MWGTRLVVLNNTRDLHSISYFLLAPSLALWQWIYAFSLPLYFFMVTVWIGIGVINHNHAHLPMWRSKLLNRCTDLAGSVLQGHPVYVFEIAHNGNHHLHNHGHGDLARTYRFGGDHNHLLGHLLHPIQVIFVLYPFFFKHIIKSRSRNPNAFHWICAQYASLIGLLLLLFLIDPIKTLVYVFIPQMICLHWLLGANYLQHAHANGVSEWNFARNFTGAINWVFFNIGLHTAHHKQPLLHWSSLPEQHRQIEQHIDKRLIESNFFWYVLRTYIFSIFKPSLRSHSLLPASEAR